MPQDPLPEWLLTWRLQVGARIRDLRLHRNLTQEGLAERLGVERRTVVRVELGLSSPRLDRIAVLAHALDVPPAELLPPLPEHTG